MMPTQSSKIELHPDAVARFNEIAIRLIDFVALASRSHAQDERKGFDPGLHIAATIQESDIIGEMKWSQADGFGNESAKYFMDDGKLYGLESSAFQEFSALAEKIHRTPAFREKVARTTIQNSLFDWVTKAKLRQTDSLPCDYIVSECSALISEYELWVPIAWLSIQEDIEIGQVVFKQITPNRYDTWKQLAVNGVSERKEGVAELYENERPKCQGYAAGVICLIAEQERAKEIALEKAEQALSILHIFSAGMFHPLITTYAQIQGKDHVETNCVHVFQNGTPIGMQMSSVRPGQPNWIMDSEQIGMIKAAGLRTLSMLLNKQRRSEFQQQLLDALLLYSRVATSSQVTDKAVYLFAPLESMFLKNDSEPIQQNLSERLAIFVGRDKTERLAIRQRVRDVYGLRSKFLHHAESIKDLRSMELFMKDVWNAFNKLVVLNDKYSLHTELLQAIDDHKIR